MKAHIKREYKSPKYSLHDVKIINFYMDGEDLVLETEYGYPDIDTGDKVDGNIRIKKVSLDDSYVYIMEYMDVLCGECGKFEGEKMELNDFLKIFKKNRDNFEIISDYEGYMTSYLSVFFTQGEKLMELSLDIFYRGDFVFEIKE